MKHIIQMVAATLIFVAIFLPCTFSVNAAAPVSPCSPADGLDSELPPDFFDEDCDGGPSCPGRIFVDMPPAGHWAHVPIDWALTHHITAGTSQNRFSCTKACTRAQAVMFLWRASGSPEPAAQVCPFQDVPTNAYYYKAVIWALEKHVTSGTSDTQFSPDRTCTRAQIVTFLWHAKGDPAPSGSSGTFPFSDVSANAYYRSAVEWATKTGVTSGTSATTFSPNRPCTRAQIVTFLYKAFHG